MGYWVRRGFCLLLALLVFSVSSGVALTRDALAVPWTSADGTGDEDANTFQTSLAPNLDLRPEVLERRRGKKGARTLPLFLSAFVAIFVGLALAKRFPPGYFARGEEERRAFRFIQGNIHLVYGALSPVYDIKPLNYNDMWLIVSTSGKDLLEAKQSIDSKVECAELPKGSVPLNELASAVKGYLSKTDRLKQKVRSDLKGICGLYAKEDKPQGLVEAARYHIDMLRSLAPSCMDRELKYTEFAEVIRWLLPLVRPKGCHLSETHILDLHVAIGATVRRMMTSLFLRNLKASNLEQVSVEKVGFNEARLAMQGFLAEFKDARTDLEIKDVPKDVLQDMGREFYINVNAQAMYEEQKVPQFSKLLVFSERFVAFRIIERLLTVNDLIVYKPTTAS